MRSSSEKQVARIRCREHRGPRDPGPHSSPKKRSEREVTDILADSAGECLEEYLAIPGLPDLTEEEVKLIDDIGRTHFVQLYVSSLRV